ncbi:MAG: Dam family site-specific DNA-(adenine-N6)-methyltransferase [Coriobacteriia bacterium]|nr:Dam family site-specific DNA-(adenine-N6)-methyltransferase [Coriobacteriia bacterium]
MRPFLNWAGGKRWLVSNYPESLTQTEGRYIEPFLGSGAVFFHLQPSSSLLSDVNSQLVETFAAVRDDSGRVYDKLREHQRRHCSEYYYRMRRSRPRTAATRAARLIYLNRTCFNGLYRVNLKGEFNVPIGSKQSVVLPDDDFAAWATALASSELVAQDFELTLESARKGDFVYVDPPYTVKHNMNNFVKYNEHIFSWSDQERLARSLTAVVDRGACVVLSNADHPSVRELYGSRSWDHMTVCRHSRLAASSDHRRPTTELLISSRTNTAAHAQKRTATGSDVRAG